MNATPSGPDQSRQRSPSLVQPALFSGVSMPAVARKHLNTLSEENRRALLSEIDAKPFNPEQRRMVEHVHGPFLALAGAGSGKTHVATHRIARLVALGVRPGRILAVTFTKKAANEMLDRCRVLLRDHTTALPKIRTLHSLGLKILEKHAPALGYNNGVRVANEIATEQFLQLGLDAVGKGASAMFEGDPLRGLAEIIGKWKNEGRDPAQILKRGDPLAPAYVTYQRWLRDTGQVDFDDLIRLPLALFTRTKEGPDAMKLWQSYFDFVVVDEYQDTNTVQDDLLRCLARDHRNLCVVGDDDQSIYGWRGAKVENIRGFAERWIGTEIVALETNYRSTGAILEVANGLIRQSKEPRHAKTLRTVHGEGKPVVLRTFTDEYQEAEWIAQAIHASGRSPGDFAILVRDQYSSKAVRFEEALAQAKIPYELWFHTDLKMGPTKRSAYSLIAAIHNPAHDESPFLQLFKSRQFQLSTSDYERLLHVRTESKRSIWEIMESADQGNISSEGRETLRSLHTVISGLHHRARLTNRAEMLSTIVLDGFRTLFPEATADGLWNDSDKRSYDTESLKRILRTIDLYEVKAKPRNRNLSSYLQFQLVEIPRRIREGESAKKANEERKSVTIMTIHASKGLEFPVVFLPAFLEGIIPHEKSFGGDEHDEEVTPANDQEEELRLAYVAATRAKEELNISYPRAMHYRSRPRKQQPSRFLGPLDLSIELMPELETPARHRRGS